MQLNLNRNYGKVIVSDNDYLDKMVAVNIENDGFEHLVFKGFITVDGLNKLKIEFESATIVETSFFGSSAYRYNENESWTFCSDNQKIAAIRCNKIVFCLVDENQVPHQIEAAAQVKNYKTNNVVNLFTK
jgi:hypothetical protein